MIKYLINILIILSLFSCKTLQKNEIISKVNTEEHNIKEIIIKPEKQNSENIEQSKKSERIFYFIGEPYYINGVKYIPEENYNYSEIGISTFYGKELHNIKTINNDINKVTELLGRHKTLPLPSMVKITNLDNGLSINIKIIDRHQDNTSLIQVSRKVAQLLGFFKDKVATVRVDILSDASKQWKNVSISLNEPEFDKTISSAPTEIVSISDIDNEGTKNNKNSNYLDPIELSAEEVSEFKLHLKVFNFENYSAIESITEKLPINIKYTTENNGNSYDIILGPIDKIDINKLVSYFISKGYKETKIILY